MVHSFTIIQSNNGNTTVVFYQDAKKRQIIFQANTEAHKDFHSLKTIREKLQPSQTIQDDITYLRKKYLFKANANNTSIFRPIAKSLIFNS